MSSFPPHLCYRCPSDISVQQASSYKVCVIGQCLTSYWPNALLSISQNSHCDFILFNNIQQLPVSPPLPPEQYDFHLVQIPLRAIIPEGSYLNLSYSNPDDYEKLFTMAKERIRYYLDAVMAWNKRHGVLTFIMNFMVPQVNPMGKLLPRYDLRNFIHFIEELNKYLYSIVSNYNNAYYFDFDQVVSTYGRKSFQDDCVWLVNHNSCLDDFDYTYDRDRLDPPQRATDIYSIKSSLYAELGWVELFSLYKIIMQKDIVKLVVFDVDDTIARGVIVDSIEKNHYELLEGWPLGIIEAIKILKNRGIILALISKNQESLLLSVWNSVFSDKLSINDFVIKKINWRSKPDNFVDILKETNLLAKNAVFVDDNPLERAQMAQSFPDVRCLGSNPLTWRRALLWSSESQTATITRESMSRPDSILQQVNRENYRKQIPRADYLKSLNVRIVVSRISHAKHPHLERAIELINKSNQFNTTGKRWTRQDIINALNNNFNIYTFDVMDIFTKYGIVGAVVVNDNNILQFVMSCRVFGLDVEFAIVELLCREIASHQTFVCVTADFIKTDFNDPASDLWSRCHFTKSGDKWTRLISHQSILPQHISIAFDEPEAPPLEGQASDNLSTSTRPMLNTIDNGESFSNNFLTNINNYENSIKTVLVNSFNLLSSAKFDIAYGCIDRVSIQAGNNFVSLSGWLYSDNLFSGLESLLCITSDGCIMSNYITTVREDVKSVLGISRSDLGFEFMLKSSSISNILSDVIIMLINNRDQKIYKIPFHDSVSNTILP